MPPSSPTPLSTDDITFELLLLTQIAQHRAAALPRPFAAALRESPLWADPVLLRTRRQRVPVWKAAVLAGLVALTPMAWLPVYADTQLRVGLNVIDAKSGKAIGGARILGENGALLGTTGPDGRITLVVPSGASDRFIIEKPGYRSIPVIRTQLRDSNLIAMLPAPKTASAETPKPITRPATPRPVPMVQATAKPKPVPTVQATPKPTPKPTVKPKPMPMVQATPKPTPKPTVKPKPVPTVQATPKPTVKPKPMPTVQATPKPTTRPATPRPVPTMQATSRPVPMMQATPLPVPTVMPTVAPMAEPTLHPATPTHFSYSTYRVRPGDTLWRIAKREYGNAIRWKVIFELNRNVVRRSDLIQPGMILKLPKSTREMLKPGWVFVRKGDSLYALAERHLGNGERWPELYRANRKHIKNPRLIQPGQRIYLPGQARAARTTRRR